MNNGFILGNKILDIVFIAAFAAQIYKCISPLFFGKKVDFSRLFSTGGMPSSHSSSTMALCTSIGIVKGYNTVEFAIAVLFAIVTMYDATGIRQEAGKHAKILNSIIDEKRFLYKEEIKELKEFLGHTPLEVLVGAILGVVISFLMKGYLLS
ncbi:divergent PAP2 family protein [Streptobacillus canis]|uniref:divergent PAP2 family protein n=1 Tax=Streptobacillus canis TaxID=2678686 RepID=UPI0012E1D94A|nr:divergent PAP2 family protein [Streptobacillus canis]